MKQLGIALFILSIITGISTAAKVNAKGEMPEHIVLFIISLIVGIISLILWHKAVKAEAKDAVKEGHTGHTPIETLKDLFSKMTTIKNDGPANENFCDQLDELSEGDIFEFHENSDILKELIGTEKAAEIILTFAQTERMLNRAWSAFSDGHKEEATSSFNLAYTNLEGLLSTHG